LRAIRDHRSQDARGVRSGAKSRRAARRAGKWLAGYISYEAGYLLEPKLRPLLPDGRRAPLLCLGVFDGPAENLPDLAIEAGDAELADPVACWSFERYRDRFHRLHRHLALGDCYQGNLTFPVARTGAATLWR
jgi:para-aminobenzoate synthetase component I